MWISKKKWQRLEKRIADLERQVQSQQFRVDIEQLEKKLISRMQKEIEQLL
ncbi:MAG: hypothetical protein HDT30_14800 [Clostridiales bacterium]|nr:hypothetical protein [Clostridiales bacterium]